MYKLCHFVLADSKVLVQFPLLGLRIKLGIVCRGLKEKHALLENTKNGCIFLSSALDEVRVLLLFLQACRGK